MLRDEAGTEIWVLLRSHFLSAIAAAWLRLWTDDDRGFGYIDSAILELAIAVLSEYRSNGVGSRLLKQALELSQGVFPAVSLSVRGDNPVVNLYQRVGLVKMEDSEIVNRVGDSSFNMVYRHIEKSNI